MHTRETHPNDCIHSTSDVMHSLRTTNPMSRHPFYNTLKCLTNQIDNEINDQSPDFVDIQDNKDMHKMFKR